MRRSITGLVVAMFVLGAVTAEAQAQTVERWNTPGSNFINRKDLFPRDKVNGKLITSVVLPTGYSSRKCWPVLYLLHGSAQGGNAGTAAPVSLQWLAIGNGELLRMNIPAIVVLPGSGDTWWVNNWWNGYRHPAFESWLLQDIVPLVTKRLRVCPGRSNHSIAGLSMGGYGAIYLASQRPDYFGSAGSFSGVLSPESHNFTSVFPSFPTIWGPPGKFYAVGHDPLALVDNLRHTRVFVGAGNGIPLAGEDTSLTAEFEELEFDQESVAFLQRARRAHVPVTFDQFAGTHTTRTWFHSLTDMLGWGPFKTGPQAPRSWTFSTVATSGTAWGYSFAFSHYFPPKQTIQLSLAHGVLRVRGAGSVQITPPHGKSVTGRIPFNVVRGKVVELRHATRPRLSGGYFPFAAVKPIVSGHPQTDIQPVQITFRTKLALPGDQEYRVSVSSLNITGSSACHDLATSVVKQPQKGKLVTVSVSPPSTATTPYTWCGGQSVAAVTTIEQQYPTLLGTLLGYTRFTLP